MSRRKDTRPSPSGQPAPEGTGALIVRRAFYALGVTVVICSAFFVAFAAGELITGVGDTEPGVLMGLVVFFLGTGVAGVMLARAHRAPRVPAAPGGPPPLPKEAAREQCILDLARAERGRVTVEEVASHCDLGISEAKTALDRFASQRVAEMRVTDSGILVYTFPGFLSDEEKRKAEQL